MIGSSTIEVFGDWLLRLATEASWRLAPQSESFPKIDILNVNSAPLWAAVLTVVQAVQALNALCRLLGDPSLSKTSRRG